MVEKRSEPFQVCICGGGNTAHFSAAVIGSNPDFRVNVFTRKPAVWAKELIGHTDESPWKHKGDLIGKLNVVSDNPKEVAKGTKFFIICGPVYAQQPILEKLAPYVEKDSYVGTVFGQGGFDWLASYVFGKKIKNNNLTIFALQNVPALCKIKTYGQAVRIIGPKLSLPFVVMQADKKEAMGDLIQDLFKIPGVALPNFLCATLTPSNQIIHPARTYGVFKDWDGKFAYDDKKLPLLYEDMDDYSAEWMIKLDNEIQAIKSAILKKYPTFDLSSVLPMQKRIIKQYGDQVKDKSTMRSTFATNTGYATLRFPLKPVEGGVVIDTNSRFFWEDIPYGLIILKDISAMLGLKCPATDFMIEWHQKFMGKKFIENGKLVKETLKETGAPSRYGIKSIDQLVKLANVKPKL